MVITLTPAAAQRLHAALDEDEEVTGIRLAARRDANGRIRYALGLDAQREGDVLHQDKGVPLLIGQPSVELLQGIEVDFGEIAPGEHGFLFVAAELRDAPGDPQGTGGCGSGGCGGGACGSCADNR